MAQYQSPIYTPRSQYPASNPECQSSPGFPAAHYAHDQSAFNDTNFLGADDTIKPQDVDEVARSLEWVPSDPPPAYQLHAYTPIIVAIPQVAPNTFRSGPMPFMRAYSPQLADFDVTKTQFVAFIDGLAIAQAPSPPIQAVQAVGQVMGFVPHHWAQLASAGVGMAAGVGSAAVSATRTKLYLQEANTRFFKPRGLQATLMPDEQLQERIYGAVDDGRHLSPIDRHSGARTLVERRLAALEFRIAGLTLDVPPPAVPTSMLDKLSAKNVKSHIDKSRENNQKEDEKARKKEKKEEEKREKREKKEEEKKEKKARKERRKERKHSDKEQDGTHARRPSTDSSLSSEAHSDSGHSSDTKKERDELKQVRKLKWIVVENLQAQRQWS